VSVLYAGADCGTCGRPLEVEEVDGFAVARCEAGDEFTVGEVTSCRGCPARIFFGGKSGKVPISLATGENHFADCPAAQRFRRRR